MDKSLYKSEQKALGFEFIGVFAFPLACLLPKASVGARLVKAKGPYRTNVPESATRIFDSLTTVTQGSPPEGDCCFICGEDASFLCSTCTLWSHRECCNALARKATATATVSTEACGAEELEPDVDLDLIEAIAQKYISSSGDAQGVNITSLIAFDSSAASDEFSHMSISLVDTSCCLCSCALQYCGYASLKGA